MFPVTMSGFLGVVEYLALLNKLTDEVSAHEEDFDRDAAGPTPAISALLHAVELYQPALHGRAPGTLVSVNLALSALQEHMSSVVPLLSDINLTTGAGAVDTAGPESPSTDRQLVATVLFGGRVLNHKKSLLHVELSEGLLAEWVHRCPSFHRSKLATTNQANAETTTVSTTGRKESTLTASQAAAQQIRHRGNAFDAAVLACSLSSKARTLTELFDSLNRACMSNSASGEVDLMSLFPAIGSLEVSVTTWSTLCLDALDACYDEVASSLLFSKDVSDALAWTLCHDRLVHDLNLIPEEGEGKGDEETISTPQAPLAYQSTGFCGSPSTEEEPGAVPTAHCDITFSGVTEEGGRQEEQEATATADALLAATQPPQEHPALISMEESPQPIMETQRNQPTNALADLITRFQTAQVRRHAAADILNTIVVCQSAEQYILVLHKLSRVVDRVSSDESGTSSNTSGVAEFAQELAMTAAEHCLSLLVSSQFVVEICERRDRVKEAIESSSLGTPVNDMMMCPVCSKSHPRTLLCMPHRKNIQRVVADSLVELLKQHQTMSSAAVTDEVHMSSTPPPPPPSSSFDKLLAAAIHQVSSLSTTLHHSMIFSRVYEMESLLLERQQKGLLADVPDPHHATASTNNSRRSTAQPSAFPDVRAVESDPDVVSSSAASPANRSAQVIAETKWSPSLKSFSNRAERELDGIFLLRPPIFSNDEIDLLRQVACGHLSKAVEGEHTTDEAWQEVILRWAQRRQLVDGWNPPARRLLDLAAEADGLTDVLLMGIDEPSKLTEIHESLGSDGHAVSTQSNTPSQASLTVPPQQLQQPSDAVNLDDIVVVKSDSDSEKADDEEGARSPFVVVEEKGGRRFSRGLLRHWSKRPKSVRALADLRHKQREPKSYLAMLQEQTEAAQALLVPQQSANSSSQMDMTQSAESLKTLIHEYQPPLHGRAPQTLLILSSACAVAARLFREGRRCLASGASASASSTNHNDDIVTIQKRQQHLALCETECWNMATGYQKTLLALTHLEPVSRCATYMERGTMFFAHSMWLASANAFAIAERILISRRDVVCSGVRRLDGLGSCEKDVESFVAQYARILPHHTWQRLRKQHNAHNKHHHHHPNPGAAVTPGPHPASEQRLLDPIALKLRYNVAVSLWCAGQLSASLEWFESSVRTSPATPGGQTGQTPQKHVGKPHAKNSSPGTTHDSMTSHLANAHRLSHVAARFCRLLIGPLSNVEHIFSFLASLSSALVAEPSNVAGGLVLVQHVVEHYISKRVCQSMTAAAKAQLRTGAISLSPTGTSVTLFPLESQVRFVAATTNEFVVQLSSGRVPDLHSALREGLPAAMGSWDKLLLHAIVTCMNFCTAFPDSVWYESAFQTHVREVEAMRRNVIVASPAQSQPATAAVGMLVGFARRLSMVFRPGADAGTAVTTPTSNATNPGATGNNGGKQPEATENDLELLFSDHSDLLLLLEWVLTTPMVTLKEEEVRVASIQLDEALLGIQTLIEVHGGGEESRQYMQEMQAHVDEALRGLSAATSFSSPAQAPNSSDGNPHVAPRPSLSSPFSNISLEELNGSTSGFSKKRTDSNDAFEVLQSPSSIVPTSAFTVSSYVPPVVLDKVSPAAQHTTAAAPWDKNVYSPLLNTKAKRGLGTSSNSVGELSQAEASLMSEVQREALHAQLPMHFQLLPWRNIYSTRHHGTSFRQLLSNCEGEQPLILAVQIVHPATHDVMLIGALIPNGLRMGNQKFYGGSDTFVFRFHPVPSGAPAEGHQGSKESLVDSEEDAAQSEHPRLDVFRWTHDNEYFVNCRMDYFAVGGGSQGAAIYVDESLVSGSTSQCQTFDSPPLTNVETTTTKGDTGKTASPPSERGQAIQFDIIALDVYSIGQSKATSR